MEFYVKVPVNIPTNLIQRDLNLLKLTMWCSSIDQVIAKEGNRAVIHSDWGTLHVHRELIQTGVRFSVTDDPHALQWTVTSDGEEVMVHCTINSLQCSDELKQRLEHFLSCWKNGVEKWQARHLAEQKKACVNCGDSFGGFG